MSSNKGSFGCLIFFVIAVILLFSLFSKNDTYHYTPSYRSNYYSSGTKSNSSSKPPVNRTPAMTREEAERLTGTGYHGCRPNSSAESTELKAAQCKCKNCGYHSDNGGNSYCDYCQWVLSHEGSLPKSDYHNSTYTPKSTEKKRSSKTKKTDDPYDVDSYSHPDDFYYDHHDDFFDYEEAEEYYNEHYDE